MTPREKLYYVYLMPLAMLVVGVIFGIVILEKSDCEAMGGKRLRGTFSWESFECYDAKQLRIIKAPA